MSTDYRPIPAILFNRLFDGCLDKYGVREKADPDAMGKHRYLVGSDGILEVYENSDGSSLFSRRSFTPVPWAVIDALTEEFETEMVSEDDHRFWGFATEEEESAFHERMAKESEEDFYKNLIYYLLGEPNSLQAGTMDMHKAEIAKALVERNESLMIPDNRQQLLRAVKAIHDFGGHGCGRPDGGQVH
jgi:hypothetical protein